MKTTLVAFFLVVGLVLSAPLARHFREGVPYTRHGDGGGTPHVNVFGDHLQLYYRLWLLGDTVFGPSEPFRNRYEFSTAPGHQAPLTGYFSPASLVFLIFSPLGPAAGYNAALLAAIVFSGLAMRALVLHYTGDRTAAIVGGTAFAAAPYTAIAVLGGHPIGLAAFYVPLSILLLERLLERRSLRTAFAAGAVFALLADNELHTLYFVALLCPLFVARHFAARPPRTWARELRALLAPLAVAAAIAACAVGLKLSLLPPSAAVGGPSRSVGEVALYAPHLRDLLDRGNGNVTTHVYPGAAICLVAAIGLTLAALRGRQADGSSFPLRHALFFSTVLAASLVLAFGPRFPLKAPYLFLYEHLPKFSLLRQTAKLMLPASFALAVLAGLGWAALRRSLPGRRGLAATGIALAAIVLDAAPFPGPGVGISLLPARVEAYERVFADRPGARVANVPIWPGNDAWTSHYLYYATRYRTIMVNGYSPIVPPGYEEQVFRPLAPLNAGQVGERQYELLRRLGVEYLIFHEESFPAKVCLFPAQYALDNLLSSRYLELAARESPVTVLRVRAPGELPAGGEPFGSSVVGVALPAARSAKGESIVDADAASGTGLVVAGQSPAVRLQRPRTTPAGSYSLAVRVRPSGSVRFSLQARRAADDAVLAERTFEEGGEGYRAVTLDFALAESIPVYYQLQHAGGGSLAVDWLYLRFADQGDPLAGFEFEELYHAGNSVPWAGASGGRVLLLTPADPEGQVTRGPYRLLEPGRYALTASLALPPGAVPPPQAVVASFVLRNHLDEVPGQRDRPENVLMAERPVTAGELAANGLRPVVFDFSIERPAFLSVNLQHFKHGLIADRVTLARVGP